MSNRKPLTLNRKHKHLLETARTRLQQGSNSMICMALSCAANHSDYKASEELQIRIHQLLYPRSTLTSWIYDQGIPRNKVTPKRIRDHRIAWIDKMLKEGVL